MKASAQEMHKQRACACMCAELRGSASAAAPPPPLLAVRDRGPTTVGGKVLRRGARERAHDRRLRRRQTRRGKRREIPYCGAQESDREEARNVVSKRGRICDFRSRTDDAGRRYVERSGRVQAEGRTSAGRLARGIRSPSRAGNRD